MRAVVTAIALLAPLAGAAHAEFRPGAFDLSEIGGHRKCRIMLAAGTRGATEGDARIPATCRRAFAALRKVLQWRPLDARRVALAEPGGRVVVEFVVAGEDTWQGDVGGMRVALVRAGNDPRAARELPPLYARPAPPPLPAGSAPAPELIAGAWRTGRGAAEIACDLTLGDRPTAGGARVASLAPSCADRGLAVFAPVAWRLEGGRLVLVARKGHDVRFAWDAAQNRWRKDPPSGADLFLAR